MRRLAAKLPRTLAAALVFTAVILLAGSPAFAHGMRGAYLEVTELPAGQASVHLRLSTPDPSLRLEPSPGCTLRDFADDGSELDRSGVLDCEGGLLGHAMTVRGLGPIVDEVVASLSFRDGTLQSALLRASEPTVEFHRPASRWAVGRRYVALGVVHILTGYDHLLFLLLLVLVVRSPRKVLLAETAFTVSHSLSFAATSLGWVHLSSPAAEACIAVSLLLLALDAERPGADAPSAWTAASMAFVFGLVHGLGFAGGLRELGVPDDRAAAALVGFGAGVELGQIAFLALVLLALYAARSWSRLRLARLCLTYGAGALSAYWLIGRVMVLVASR